MFASAVAIIGRTTRISTSEKDNAKLEIKLLNGYPTREAAEDAMLLQSKIELALAGFNGWGLEDEIINKTDLYIQSIKLLFNRDAGSHTEYKETVLWIDICPIIDDPER